MKRVLGVLILAGFLGAVIGLGVFESYAEQTRRDNEAMKVIIQHRIERITPGVYGTYGYTCVVAPEGEPMCDVLKTLNQMQDAL